MIYRTLPILIVFVFLLHACQTDKHMDSISNPFLTELNVPVDYARVTAQDVADYTAWTADTVVRILEEIKTTSPTWSSTIVAYDEASNLLSKAMNRTFLLYWVSPDSLTRDHGLAGYQMLDSLYNEIASDKKLYQKMVDFSATPPYTQLTGHRKKMVDDLLDGFRHAGVDLPEALLDQYQELNADITRLTTEYSTNMNSADVVLTLTEEETAGLPDNFKITYRTDDQQYEIPVMPATRQPVLDNALVESTRKAYLAAYHSRAAEKNLPILDSLIQKRYEIGQIMGKSSYAAYNLLPKMAENPERVWTFLGDLIEKVGAKAAQEEKRLQAFRQAQTGQSPDMPIEPWDFGYYRNQLLKEAYQVDQEKIREYLPMQACLDGLFRIYQQLLGLEFRLVPDASVWHEEVEMYEVYEADTLKGRFYLDLFPRPNKESWFYGVPLTAGRQTDAGYEVPVNMLLGNFTRPTETLPSLLSHSELNTLFHEFGHIMDGIAYHGEFALQADSKADFVEAMSQIFENWIWDYDMLSSFSRHYETGETIPRELFDKMYAAKNVTSGLSTLRSLKLCTYDMTIYDRFDPNDPIDTDALWQQIDTELGGVPYYMKGTHPQSSWIHINTHPVYYYGYLWSEVYAQDMFTLFEQNGLLDQESGVRYRQIILANGSQRKIDAAVEDFLGRPSNNQAYVKSLGLE